MTTSEDEKIIESQIEPAGLPGVLENESTRKQEELLNKDHTINNLNEETTTVTTDVYQQSQQIPATSYKKKLLSLFNKLLLCFNLGDKQNQRHDDSISLYMDHDQGKKEDHECVWDKLQPGSYALSSSEYLELFSKLSYERKGFDGRGNDSQEQVLQPVPVPVPTPVLKT